LKAGAPLLVSLLYYPFNNSFTSTTSHGYAHLFANVEVAKHH
jgi:hypothetical protein